jgi:hypothetical protein
MLSWFRWDIPILKIASFGYSRQIAHDSARKGNDVNASLGTKFYASFHVVQSRASVNLDFCVLNIVLDRLMHHIRSINSLQLLVIPKNIMRHI